MKAHFSLFVVLSLSLAFSSRADPPPLRASFSPTLDPLANQFFSTSVAVSDHYAIVGTPTVGNGNGAVYVFDLYGANANSASVVLRDANSSTSYFGSAVAISGSRLAVGAPGSSQGGATPTEQRSVYLYDLSNATPALPTHQISVFSTYNTAFGRQIAMSGNILALPSYDGSIKILLYDLTSPDPTQPFLTISRPSPMIGGFGQSVAIWNNFLAVGAEGQVFLYDLQSSNPSSYFRVLSSPTDAGFRNFGKTISLSEKFLAVGCWSSDFHDHDVFVYSTATRFASEALILPTSTSYGASVAISDTRVLVGSNGVRGTFEVPDRPPTETVLVFDINEPVTAYTQTELRNPTPGYFDNFGLHLAATSRRILVGAPSDDAPQIDSGQAFLYGEDFTTPPPSIEIRDQDGNLISNSQYLVDIGGVAIGTSEARDFLVTNAGEGDLSIESIAIDGTNAENFSASLQSTSLIPPGGSRHLSVSFSPTTSGHADAVLQLECNDPNNNPFSISLAGLGATDHEYWRLVYFGIADNSGSASDNADPDGDGNDNLLEYLAGLNPLDSTSHLLLAVGLTPAPNGFPVVTFAPVLDTRVYEIQATTDLLNPNWETLTDVSVSDSNNQRSVTDNAGGPEKYYRLTISRDETEQRGRPTRSRFLRPRQK